jgi:hypothetical protein
MEGGYPVLGKRCAMKSAPIAHHCVGKVRSGGVLYYVPLRIAHRSAMSNAPLRAVCALC